jgi:hypothetical protein
VNGKWPGSRDPDEKGEVGDQHVTGRRPFENGCLIYLFILLILDINHKRGHPFLNSLLVRVHIPVKSNRWITSRVGII